MTVHDQLFEKMSDEYDRFIAGLEKKPPGEIIKNAYEKVFKEEILGIFENDENIIGSDEAAMLLTFDDPLQQLYDGWLDWDSSYLDQLRDSIDSRVEVLAEEIEMYGPVVPDKTATAVNGEIKSGDWVIATPDDEYGCLIGQVIEIVKLGTPEHEAEAQNDTDNIHVNFYAFDYPPERIAEIEAHFSELYGEPKTFDELPLDDVIKAPDMLIRITELGHDEIARMGNLLANCESYCACFSGAVPQSEKHAMLIDRIEENLGYYQESLMRFGKRELIEKAGKINAMSDAHDFLSNHRLEESELDFLLRFQNPLELVANEWNDRHDDLDDMSFTIGDIMRNQADFLASNPLMNDAPVAKTIAPIEKAEPSADKPRQTLSEKLQAAGEKAKAQKAQHNNMTSHIREERE